MLMRSYRDIGDGIKEGEVFVANRLSPTLREALLKRGAIRPVSAPPVAVLPGIERVLDVLVAAGVQTLGALVQAEAVEGLTAEELAFWQKEAMDAVTVEKQCNCRKRR
jgi:hypothetical protein